jgi:hypothetical protein
VNHLIAGAIGPTPTATVCIIRTKLVTTYSQTPQRKIWLTRASSMIELLGLCCLAWFCWQMGWSSCFKFALLLSALHRILSMVKLKYCLKQSRMTVKCISTVWLGVVKDWIVFWFLRSGQSCCQFSYLQWWSSRAS